ncbi:MAG TPA: hypothetical protein PKC73_11840 [Dermatophilaceae bacterium]|jgi:predicted alpha/beta-hydrolase family hydrolase|nr:hypothetical protein [Dermatophilaceae bacterium]HMT90313.1 hypothetical protein [Dermatophilaceae bacterium]
MSAVSPSRDEASVLLLETPTGQARAHVYAASGTPRGRAALGHGAGPSITTVDLIAARKTLCDNGFSVAVIEQPWMVAGRKVAVRPPLLDQAWIPVLHQLEVGIWADVAGPLLVAGRSAGARVACRTATAVGASAVLALSFPLHPPGKPEASRGEELITPVRAGIPVAVVQGESDPFGTPAEVTAYLDSVGLEGNPRVDAVPGTHTIPARAAAIYTGAVTSALGVLLA